MKPIDLFCVFTVALLRLTFAQNTPIAPDELAAQATSVTATRTIHLPTTRPSDTFVVPPNFVSVGFESAFLPSYDNELSANLVDSIQSRLSAPIVIRIGGTSGDRLTIDPNQQQATKCVGPKCPDGSGATFILGPSYFESFKRFPGSHFSIQGPIDMDRKVVNATNVRALVSRAKSAVGLERIAAIQIGNEVQLYEPSARAYVKDAKEVMKDVQRDLALGEDDRRFEVLDTASGVVGGGSFQVQDAFRAGLGSISKQIKHVGEHYYQISAQSPADPVIQTILLNHTAIVSRFKAYMPHINFLRNQQPGISYVLSETGSALKGSTKFQAFFASALWSVDFQLYAMSKGVSRVSGTQRPVAKHSLWIPPTNGEGGKVQGPFYAQPFVADFIGKNATGERGVVNIDLNSAFLSAYAMFEGATLKRIAILNLREYTGRGQRNAKKITLTGLGDVRTARVGRLHAAAGTDAGGFDANGKNITWEGRQWSFRVDKGKGHGERNMGEVSLRDGMVSLRVLDSEAVVVYLGD